MTATVPGRLVTLVRRADRPVCVLMPGAGGGLQPYLRLAGYLGRFYQVCAVRASGLLPGDAEEDSVPAMADAALTALGGRSPELVFGWSLGGTVGWELCVRLADRGTCPDLVIVDSSPLPRRPVPETDERIWDIIAAGLGPRPDPATVTRLRDTFRTQLRVLAGYAATRSYPGRVLLLMCPDTPADGITGRADAVRRWRELAPNLRMATLDADHYAVFDPSHLPLLATEMAGFLGIDPDGAAP